MNRVARPALYAGLAAAVLGLSKLHAAAVATLGYDFTDTARFGWAIVYIGLLCVAAYAVGLPELPRTRRAALASAVTAPSIGAGAFSVLQLATGVALLPRFVVFGAAAIAVPWSMLCATAARDGRTRASARDRVLLVSQHEEAVALRDELDALPEWPAAVVDHLTPAETLPLASLAHPLCERAAATNATVVVLDRAALVEPSVVAQAARLHESGLRVRTLTAFYEHWLGKLPVTELERASLLFDIGELHGSGYGRWKRLADVSLAVIGLVVLAAVAPLVAAGNLVGNRGPLVYRQARVGRFGREFTILKFRTMRTGGDDTSTWTQADDPRVTPFGRVLRRTHLDELPQLLNVLRGDLSVVGPRPEQPRYVDELKAKLPFYDLRHLVRPGVTGWAQVKYGYAADDRDALEKLQYEFWYLQHQGLALDVRIIGRTLRSLAGGVGAGR